MPKPNDEKLDQIVAQARRDKEQRERGYRAKALKMYPHVCGRCGREFAGRNLQELTVHHRDHDHDNNPEDGSNWELLCLYCHDNEHQRQLEAVTAGQQERSKSGAYSSSNPFADLKDMLNAKNSSD